MLHAQHAATLHKASSPEIIYLCFRVEPHVDYNTSVVFC